MRLKLLIFLLIPALGCSGKPSDDDNEASRISRAFLTIFDASMANTPNPIASNPMPLLLSQYEYLYLNAPEVEDKERDCFDKKLDQIGFKLFTATSTEPASAKHGIETDYVSCRKLSRKTGEKVKTSQLRFFQKFGCRFRDPNHQLSGDEIEIPDTASIAKFSGSPSNILELGRAQKCTKRFWQITADINSEIYGVDAEENQISYFERSVLLLGDENLRPCEESLVEGVWNMQNDCQYVKRTARSNHYINAAFQKSSEDYIKLNVTSPLQYLDDSSATWFESGVFAVTLNNWTGTVAYNSDQIAPTYTMSNSIQALSDELTQRSD